MYRSPNSKLDNDDKLFNSIQTLSKNYFQNLIITGDFIFTLIQSGIIHQWK